MKKYIYLIMLVVPLVIISCGDSFLEEKPKNFDAPENIYTNTTGFNAALNGLYAYSRLEFQTWTDGIITHGACPYETMQVGLDICVRSYKDGTLEPFETYKFNPTTSYIRNRWKWAYGLIANANQMINYAENTDISWDNPATDKAYFQAQGKFFRAYAYRYLTYLFGDVAWVTEVSDSYRSDFERTPQNEVLQKMIEDLKFAAEHLPADPSSVKQGQLTKWTALHMLSEIYLFKKEYKNAENAALEVINSGYYQLMTARFGNHKNEEGDYYSDMFKENNHNRTSGNMESIWVIQAEYDKQGGGGKYNDWTRRAWVPGYYNIDGFVISVEYGGRGLGQIRPLEWLLDSYETDDVRNSANNIRRDYYYNSTAPEYAHLYGKKHTITNTDINTGKCFPTTTKFDYGVANNLTYEGNSKDKTRFRLAETYLFLAEAYLMQGNTGAAAEAINTGRARANATPVQESATTLDYLLDERARELLGEEMRRFTLIRTGKLIERTTKMNSFSGPVISDYNVLWPVPQEVIDANSGLKWINNPGYN
jgi:hypothetical protein